MTAHLKPWLAHLVCTHATLTAIAATVGNWVSCGTCHTQERIVSVSYALTIIPDEPLVQGELFPIAEIRRAA